MKKIKDETYMMNYKICIVSNNIESWLNLKK